MKYPPNVWQQLKGLTPKELIKALEKDGWKRDEAYGQSYVYYNPRNKRRITVHYHARPYEPNLLKFLLGEIGWDISDFKRLKLIKK